MVNGAAIYFPRAKPKALPVIRYSRHRNDQKGFNVAREVDSIEGPGTAVSLELCGELTDVHLATAAVSMHQRLRNILGEAHAFYYR